MRFNLKTAGLALGGIIMFLAILILCISAGAFNSRLAKTISSITSRHMNGTLAIEEIEGNPLSHFFIRNVRVFQKGKVILDIDELEVDYKPWKVIGKKLQANNLRINGIRVILVEEADSLWNVQKLFVRSSAAPVDTVVHPSSWHIEMADIRISNVEASIFTLDSLKTIPRFLEFNASLKFAHQHEYTQLDLSQFELITQKPALEIIHLAFQALHTDSVITWNNFELRLPHSTLHSEGTIPLKDLQFSQLSLSASPIDFKDLAGWMPDIHGNPAIQLEINNEGRFSNIDLNIIQDNQSVTIQGNISDLDRSPTFNFLLDADSINGEYWTHKQELKSNVNGQVELTGRGFDFRQNSMIARAQFADLKYDKYEIKDFLLYLEKNDELLKGNMKANTIFGKLDWEMRIEDIFNSPVYDATLQFRHINLAKLTLNEKLESSINLDIQANGEGFVPGKVNADFKLKSTKSVLFDQPIIDFDSRIALHGEEYQINRFRMETPYLLAVLSGDGNLSEHNQLQFNLKVKNLEKAAEALGLGAIKVEGELDGSLTGSASELTFISHIEVADLRTDSLLLRNVRSHLISRFSLKLPFAGIESPRWSDRDSMLTLKNLYLKTDNDLEFASFGKYYLEETVLNLEKKEETLEGRLTTNSTLGMLDSYFNIGHVFSTPEYHIKTSITSLDLSKISQNKDYNSDINLDIELEGVGIESESLQANLELRSKGSSVFGWPVDDFNSSIRLDEKEYLVERFNVKTPFAEFSVNGAGDWIHNNNLVFDLKTKDSGKIPPIFGPGNMEFSAQLNGRLSGTQDSLKISSKLNLQNLAFDTIHVEKLFAEAEVQIIDSTYSGFLNMQMLDSRIQDFILKEVQLTSNFNQEVANNSFTFYANDTLKGKVLSSLYFGNNPTLYLPEIDIYYLGNHWKGGGNSSYIRFRKDSIEINEIEFTSGESALKAGGIFAFRGSEDLHLEIQNFKLIPIPGLKLFPYPVSGIANATLDVAGTAENPIILGSMDIFEPVIDTLRFSRFHTNFGYSSEKLSLESYLNDFSAQLVYADMELPIHVSLTDSIFLFRESNVFHANIALDQLQLTRFNSFIPLKGAEAYGLLTAKIGISNAVDNPFVNGSLFLDRGAFVYNKLGINYNNIELRSRFNDTLFYLDSLDVFSGNGALNLKGSAEMGSLFTGELRRVSLNLKGQNFKAFDSEMLRAVINTDLDLNGNLENPVFSGNLTVLRSSFNTDLFQKEFNRAPESDQPMLVMARSEAENMNFSAVIEKDTTRKPPPDIYKNLTGQFDIVIPRNTWAKGKNMNFELAGTLKAIKEGERIDLFGSVMVKRGYYKIYGRRLEFEKGEVILAGGKPINPAVDFLMAYKFRDPDHLLRKLTVIVSGRVSKPDIKFYLDGQAIEEKDAISYLLFNKNTDQLDASENSMVKKNNLDVARDLTFGQLSNVVNDVLQSSLGLDVIEISGQDGWTQGSVSVGKYISNNLFLNYERTFSLDKKDKIIEPQKISLEYQIYRLLFLQGVNQSTNSGFDFILKWTWK